MSKYGKKIQTITEMEQKLQIKKSLLIQGALKSSSPSDILAAQKFLQGVEERKVVDKKSYLLDPLDLSSQFGYKDKPLQLSYNTLKVMSKVHIPNLIIKTRKNQIADFAEPQNDKYSTGFKIQKKRKSGVAEIENTLEESRKIDKITEFMMNCGSGNTWDNDDFETFIRKIVEDSLTYDQMTFETVRDKKGNLFEFFATDASTFRVADTYDSDEENNTAGRVKLNGYYPKYVQLYNGSVVNDFYPWELCFGVRNPSTSIYNVGYGVSELEELVGTITSILWADDYNKKFFSQGSAPKGLLKIKSSVNPKQLDAFRQEWNSTLNGVSNAWKTPVVDQDVDWVDLHKSNKDMEYSAWMDFLIKISCGVYSIDPNEIGFDINKSSEQKSMFDSNNEGKLKHSKDKGLYPILKFIQRKINKNIVSQIDPDYEFLFVGINGMTIQEELDMEIKKLSNFQTLNETRSKYNMDKVENGDIILNPTYTQNLMMSRQSGTPNPTNPFIQGQEQHEENPFMSEDYDDENNNPFLKSFLNTLNK